MRCSALSLVELAEFAKLRGAVIFLSVGGQVGRSGQLQEFLSEQGIPFTGPGSVSCMTCADRVSNFCTYYGKEEVHNTGKAKLWKSRTHTHTQPQTTNLESKTRHGACSSRNPCQSRAFPSHRAWLRGRHDLC